MPYGNSLVLTKNTHGAIILVRMRAVLLTGKGGARFYFTLIRQR